MLSAVNQTLISLIPKVKNTTKVSDFRPISLCNVIYKNISKILSERRKPLLSKCISENQATFIPGRQILDNVAIAHEFLHHLNRMRGGNEGYLALKLDMSNAYDTEWRFICQMLWRMGFAPIFVIWIVNCFKSVSFSLLVSCTPR